MGGCRVGHRGEVIGRVATASKEALVVCAGDERQVFQIRGWLPLKGYPGFHRSINGDNERLARKGLYLGRDARKGSFCLDVKGLQLC